MVIKPKFPFFYDIACRVGGALKKLAEIPGIPQAAVASIRATTGQVHGSTHSKSYQLQTNCRYQEGAGHCCGECNEPIWYCVCKSQSISKYKSAVNYALDYDLACIAQNERAAAALPQYLLASSKRAGSALAAAVRELPALYETAGHGVATAATPLDTLTAHCEADLTTCKALAKRQDDETASITRKDMNYVRALVCVLEEEGRAKACVCVSCSGQVG